MTIDFEKETKSITSGIRLADDYLGCEDVIIAHIKMLLDKEENIPVIENHLKQLHEHFNDLIKKKSGTTDCIKYINASGFLKVLTESIYWHSWIKVIK
jgi:hypothetical protein